MPTLDELLAYAPAAPAPTQSGLRRRALLENTGLIQRQQEAQNAAPAVASDPYADNWLAQTARSQTERLVSSVPALGVLGAKLVGADEKASEWANNFREMDERATMLGPKVQDFSLDNDLAGNASALGYNLAGLVPDLAMTLTGAGVGAVAGRKVAGGLARRGAREIASETASTVAEKAAVRAPGATAQSAAEASQAARIAADAGIADPVAHAARQAGLRTSVDAARAARFEKIGSGAGVIAGQFPSLNRENVESLDKDTTSQGDAFATLIGTTGASALGILPVERFLGRFGAEAKAQVAKKAQELLPRVAKEAATQGLAEGSTEVFQTAAMRATHQYVGENVNLFDADALNEYLGAFLAGGVLGSTVGGGAEAARSVGDFGLGSAKKRIGEWGDMRRAARVEKRKIKAGDEIPLEGAVAKDTVDTFNQHADDLKFDEDLNADATDAEREVDARYEAFRKADANPTIDILQRSPSQLPIEFETPLQQMLMGAVNADAPLWSNPAEANGAASALQRLMLGESLSNGDKQMLVGLSDQMKPGAMRTLFAEADNFAAQVKALDADGLWTKSKVAVDESPDGAPLVARTTEQEALAAQLDAPAVVDTTTAEDDVDTQDTYGLNVDKPENRPHVRLFSMTRKDPDFEKVKSEVADNVLKRANNWTPNAYAARANYPGYVGVRGAPGQLLDLGALASYVRGRDGEQAPLKVAMMAGLAEAIASDVKIDTDTLTPGKITIKNTNEVFELTQGDIEGLKRLQVSRAPTFAERVVRAAPTAAQRARQELHATLPDTRGARREDEEDFINTADEAGVALGDVDPRLVARKAPPTTNRGNIRDVRVADDLGDAAQLNEARRPLAALSDAIGVDVKSILKISTDLRERRTRAALARKRGDAPIPSDANRAVPAVITLASGGTVNADVPYALLGFNRLLNKKSNTEAPTPKPTAIEEAETEGRAATTDALVEGAASFDKRRFAGLKKTYKELVEKLDSIRAPAVRARLEKEAADLIAKGRALRAKIADVENNVRNVERKSFENESARGSRATIREAAPRAQTPFEAGVAIGEKRLELQYPGDLYDSRAHNLALKELRDPKSGVAVKYYERALRGEFGSARVYEQAWDAYEQDNDEMAREREFNENAPTPAPKPSADIDTSSAPAFARAKEAAKAKGAKWVLAAEGVAGSFASRIAAQAKALGRLITADTLDSVQPGDVVYMSVPGANRGYEIKGSVYGLLAKILKRGARVRGDNDYHAHRAHNANSEGVIYDALENAGFTRTENSNFAEWTKKADDDLQDDDSDTDGTASEPFDLDKTQAMVDALLKRMGITEPVKLTTTQFEDGKKTARGTYSRARGAIFINPKFTAAERFETLTHELGHHVMAAQWDKASPETRAAIEADYKKWLKNNKRSKRAGNATLIYASRATFLRSQAALAKDTPTTPEAVEYAASFDEYVADGIARALNQNADAQSVVDKFFKSIADQLRKLYDAITGAAKGAKWKAPASIDAWVKSLFDANVAAVHQVSGATLPAASAAGAVRAAGQIVAGSAPAKKWTRADFKGLMQFMSTVLPPNARLDLERAFNRPVALAQVRKHFAKDPTVLQFLDDSHVGLEAALAAGYLAWQDGAFAAGPKGKQAFMDFGDSVAQLFGVSATGDLVERTLSDIADGTVERMRANHDVYSARKGAAADNGKLQKALNWMVEDGPIKRAMSGYWTGVQSRLEATGIPAFRAINAELLLPRGKVSGDPGMIVDIRKQLHSYNRSINNALKDLTDTERNDAVNTLQQAAGKGDAVYDTQPEKVRTAVDGVRAVMQQLAAAASQVEAFGPKFKPPANYFPVVMDIREEGARTKLEALYRKPKFKLHVFLAAGYDNKADHTPANFEKAITFLLDAAAGDYEATQGGASSPTSRSLKRRLSRFVYDHGDANDIREFAALQSKDIDEIFARHLGPMTRMIEFRKRFGEAKVDANGKRTYDPRAKLDELLALAKSQGAKKEDLEYAENAVQAALGNYGTDVSPVLSLLSPDLAKRFSGQKTKRTIQIAQAYQNTRLLPLAILSSLVDPIGIAVRTGGDFKSAWTGMRAGMKALFDKGAGQDALDLLERIDAADEFMPALASHALFDGPENAWAQRINHFVFRANGMSALVQSTRVMAAYAGQAFLLKHADGAREGDKDSIRYLQELNVSPADIVEDPNKPGSVVLTDSTKEALRRFVDEAILRPNSQQAPLWHRDPFMGLVTQYSGFTYAIYDQITKRMGHELRHGNSWVVLAALAYLPIVLMAEFMREWLQYGPDGKPSRKDWGAADYTMHAAVRTGLLGPKFDVIGGIRGDLDHNRIPGSSQLGPTIGQASNALDAFRGYRELDKEVESALPASALWKHWNDNFGAST